MTEYLFTVFLLVSLNSDAFATCSVVEDGKKTSFDGKTLRGLLVEKKSVAILNREFPNLNVIEKMFKGEIFTCSDCQEKYIICIESKEAG